MNPCLTRLLLAALFCAACLFLHSVHAIGPVLPIEIVPDDEERGWEIAIQVDTRQARINKIERQIYSRGEQLQEEAVEPTYDKQSEVSERLTGKLSLRSKQLESLKPGTYAQKLVIEGEWLPEGSAKPLHIERWFYFVLRDGHVERISAEQYDALADPADVTIDSQGRQRLLNKGYESKESPPEAKGKSSQAVPLGRFGGAVEEYVPNGDAAAKTSAEQDRSEAEED